MFRSFVVTALFMVSTPSKWVPLIKSFRLRNNKSKGQHQRNREVVLGRRYSPRPGIVGCCGRCDLMYCHEAATICPATTPVCFYSLSERNVAGYICRFADLSSHSVAKLEEPADDQNTAPAFPDPRYHQSWFLKVSCNHLALPRALL